jgi:LmbE family N-acetylglucosaminyl deacetylase
VLRAGTDKSVRSISTVLCLGAHSDDIELGCGGTLLRLLEENERIRVHWIVFSSGPERSEEALRAADVFLERAGDRAVDVLDFRERYFPFVGAHITEYFDALGERVDPDVIFTHRREDQHQDHRLVAELTWQTFRDHLILEYEIPKYEGDLGNPNVFIELDRSVCDRKVKYLLDSFKSQEEKDWFTEETLMAVLRLRGVEGGSRTGYAEGFQCRKLVLT